MCGLIHCYLSSFLPSHLPVLRLPQPLSSSFSGKKAGESKHEHGVTTAAGGKGAAEGAAAAGGGTGTASASSEGSIAALARYREETARCEALLQGMSDDSIEDFMNGLEVDDKTVSLRMVIWNGAQPVVPHG